MANRRYPDTMSAEIFPRVTVDPNVCFGKPTIRGMRNPGKRRAEHAGGGHER